MSGYEVIGKEELKNIIDIFKRSNGVLFSHSFDKRRNKIYRVKLFEKLFAKKIKSKYAIACSSGTAAGALCLRAAGVKPGDEVITQAFTFVAAIESILEVGAVPKIVDVDNSLNMSPSKLIRAISKKTKCILPVHMLGAPANMKEITRIAKKYKISVIEDACESTGVKYKNKYLGTLGLSGFFSLDFGKIITTGEGGIIVTNNKQQYLLLKALRDHGHENKFGIHRGLDKALIRGFNFRMTEIQAAIGIAQLKKLDFIMEKKRVNRNILLNEIKKRSNEINVRFSHEKTKYGEQNDHLVIHLKNKIVAKKVKKLLDKANIPTGILPMAVRWHYAGYWQHIWRENKKYRNYRKLNYWKNTWSIICRSISFPISILEKKNIIIKKADTISKIINKSG